MDNNNSDRRTGRDRRRGVDRRAKQRTEFDRRCADRRDDEDGGSKNIQGLDKYLSDQYKQEEIASNNLLFSDPRVRQAKSKYDAEKNYRLVQEEEDKKRLAKNLLLSNGLSPNMPASNILIKYKSNGKFKL